jgi:uncharacterized membrane protein
MIALIVGLVVFLGAHSIGVLAPRWRDAQIVRLGAHGWKLAFSAASIVGFVLMVWGYGMARTEDVVLWISPIWVRHLTAVLVVLAFILVVAAYVPNTYFKSALGHPMTAGVGIWAFGHLLSNGSLRALILFGAFLAWSIAVFTARRRRDREAGVAYPPWRARRNAVAIVVGVVAALVFALFLHGPLIGVRPFAA